MLNQNIPVILGKAQEAWLQLDDLVRPHFYGAKITGFDGEDSRIR